MNRRALLGATYFQYYELSQMRFAFSSVDVVILSDLRGAPLWTAVTCYRFVIAGT
jgi:hypothetical protein